MKTVNSRTACIVLMLIICAVFGIYRLGWFDVSFVVRPSAEYEDAVTSSENAVTDAPDTVFVADSETENGTEAGSSENDTQTVPMETDSAETVGENNIGAGEESPFIFADDAEDNDYKYSYDDWESDGEWILAASDMTLPSYFSKTKTTAYTVTYEMQEDRTPYKAVYTPYEKDKTAVTLYMGYIITETDKEGVVNIYSSDGELIGSYDEEKITPAWCRDNGDRPLFIYKDAYYYLDEKNGNFIEADYIPDRDSRGAEFDYTPDYGDDTGSRTFAVSEEVVDVYEPIPKMFDEEGFQLAYKIPTVIYKYTLTDTAGAVLSDSVFYGAYAFSGSRAAVIDEEGHLYYITRSGSVAVRTGKVRRDIELGRSVFDFYMEPITNGEESIGFYYFEHGLSRVRLMSVDYYRYDKDKTVYVVSDNDLLIYANGDKFPVPEGYDIISYSSGMILLEKDGKYGYMDYTGDWIVDPVLTYAEPFYEGLAVIGAGEDGELRALIDTNGEYVIPPGEFSYISHASTGVFAVYGESDGWRILYKMQKD